MHYSDPRFFATKGCGSTGDFHPICSSQGDFIIDVITIETLQENKENYTRFMLHNGHSEPWKWQW